MRHTKKQKYQRNRSHLRKLLRHFRDGVGGRTPVSGKFGYVFNQKYAYHQIVNTLNGTVIATVKSRGDKLIIRYRPNSWYSDLLSDTTRFVSPRHANAVAVPSGSLARHRGDAVTQVRDAVQREELHRQQLDRIAREEVTAEETPDRFTVTPEMRSIQQRMMDEYMARHPMGIGVTTPTYSTGTLTDEDIRTATEALRHREPTQNPFHSVFRQEYVAPDTATFAVEGDAVWVPSTMEYPTQADAPLSTQEQLDSLGEEENVDF